MQNTMSTISLSNLGYLSATHPLEFLPSLARLVGCDLSWLEIEL